MDIDEARAMATDLMGHHHLAGWQLVFDRARTRAGVCRYDRREIGLSRVLTALHPPDLVRGTILHEIAHALVGPGHAHDEVWRATAIAIGGDGLRRVSPLAPTPPAPWVGRCAHGHEVTRHRRPVRPASCLICASTFDVAHLLVWRFHGRAVALPAAYEAELARARAAAARDRDAGSTSPLAGALPLGSPVVLHGAGKYSGLTGRIAKRGRTRYHVRTRIGTVTAPFALVWALAG